MIIQLQDYLVNVNCSGYIITLSSDYNGKIGWHCDSLDRIRLTKQSVPDALCDAMNAYVSNDGYADMQLDSYLIRLGFFCRKYSIFESVLNQSS